MDQGIIEKVERLKAKADVFLKNDIRAFIKDFDDNFYFCDVLLVGELKLLISNFAGKRKGEKTDLYWQDIKSIDEYSEEDQ